MFLSFIVPVYNVEKYLAECLDSLLNQDISHEDYEIICVNDGSTDGSLEILRHYEKMYSGIHVIDQNNSGVAMARNVGLDAAKGDFIWFIDSDDFIKRKFLPELYKHIEETNSDRIKIGTYTMNEGMSESEVAALQRGEKKVSSRFYDSSSVTCVLRRSFLLQNGCRFNYPELTHGEDSIFMYEVIACNPKCTKIETPVYFYRYRHNSAMTSRGAEHEKRKLKSYFLAAQIMKKHYDNGTGAPRETANLLMSYIWYVMSGCASLSGKERKDIVGRMKALRLYPFRRPDACTHKRSYQTTRTDIVGKIFDKIYINTHRPWGYAAMILYQRVWNLMKQLKR